MTPAYGPHPAPYGFDPAVCQGLFVGGCVARGIGSSFRAKAHAHNKRGHQHYGWICVRAPRRVYIRGADMPSALLWHEYAHLLTPNHGHDNTWRRMMRRLGQRIPRQYHKKSPTRSAPASMRRDRT
jgi:hypothetical protein